VAFSRYYRFKLSKENQKVYDEILIGLENRKNKISSSVLCSSEDFGKIIFSINYDNPQLYYVDFSRIVLVRSIFSCTYSLEYLIDIKSQKSLDSRINNVVEQILGNVVGKSLKKATLIVHDWLVKNCSYGDCITYPNAAHSILGPLLCSQCVCEGYAKVFKFILDQIKIRCIVVVGKGNHPDGSSGNHAWNLVKIENNNYHVDVTFDLLFAGEYCSRAYFMLSTLEISYDHIIDNTIPIPECNTSGSLLKTVSSTTELLKFLAAESKSGVTHSEVRLSKGFTKEKLMTMIKKKMSLKDYFWYSRIKSYGYGDHCRTLFVSWV
jgi:hypothetical protein